MSTAAEEHVLSAAEMTSLKHSPDRRSRGCWAGVEWISTITQPTPSGAEMIGRPMLAVTETGERFSGVINAAEETESGWQYTLQQHPVEAPELHPVDLPPPVRRPTNGGRGGGQPDEHR